MSSVATPVAHERVMRWLEEGQGQFSALLGILNDYHRLQRVVETHEQELEQQRGLQDEVEKLRNQLRTSESESDKLRHEVGISGARRNAMSRSARTSRPPSPAR
jgi:hypothetical protein